MSQNLKKLDNFQGRPGPLMLIIMDGVGIGKEDDSNGVFLAKTPCLDKLMQEKLYTTLRAHGTAVGMPSDDDMGNSEVGHNALGAGRVFDQGALLVQNDIDAGEIFNTEIWKEIISKSKKEGQALHLVGLLSDGNVHSHIDHLFSILRHAAEAGIQKVCVHALLDGRDVYEKSALDYIEKTEKVMKELNAAHKVDYKIASGGGRMVTTMDRYNADWSVVKRGWDAHVLGKARMFSSAKEAISTYYEEDEKITDQYLDSFVIEENGKPVGTINDGDVVVFFNFRGDRAIELSRAFDEEDFSEFERERVPDVLYAGMMEYDGDLHVPKHYLVNPPQIDKALSTYICKEGIKSFAISETQKYGHVTYFWNGNKSGYVDEKLEKYVEIPSDKIRFDKAPKMKASEIADETIKMLESGEFAFGRLNFANGDMVGHTGVREAIVEAMEAVDENVAKVIDTVKRLNGIVIVTADHGNSEEIYTLKKGEKVVSTAHSLNPVPFAIIDSAYNGEYKMASLDKKGLSNIASTILNLLGYEKPDDYDPSLIEFEK